MTMYKSSETFAKALDGRQGVLGGEGRNVERGCEPAVIRFVLHSIHKPKDLHEDEDEDEDEDEVPPAR